jgi:hypothetical protein
LQELLDHLHAGIVIVMQSGRAQDDHKIVVDAKAWQSLLVLQADISELIRSIEDPPDSLVRDHDTGEE